MRSHHSSFPLLLLLTGAACVDTPPQQPSQRQSPRPLRGTGQSLDPWIWEQPRVDTFSVLLNANKFPDWRVELPHGGTEVTRRIEVVVGRAVEMRVRSDRAATIEIPALRVGAQVKPGTPETFSFRPLVAGEYDMLVSSERGRCDGKLVVLTVAEDAEGFRERILAPVVEDRARAAVGEERLEQAAAARDQIVALLVEQWRPTGNGDRAMRWLVPIPVAELVGLDPRAPSPGPVVDSSGTLATRGYSGVVHTKRGVFSFWFASDKLAARTYHATLTPLDSEAGRVRTVLLWDREAGERLVRELESLLEVHAAKAIPTGEARGGSLFK